MNPRLPICRLVNIPLDQWQVLTYHRSGTMYRPRDEKKFFLQIEGCFGFPHYSNHRTTKRKVCLRPGTEILAPATSFAEKTARRNVAPERWVFLARTGGGGGGGLIGNETEGYNVGKGG